MDTTIGYPETRICLDTNTWRIFKVRDILPCIGNPESLTPQDEELFIGIRPNQELELVEQTYPGTLSCVRKQIQIIEDPEYLEHLFTGDVISATERAFEIIE